MLRIALCDDREDELASIVRLMEAYLSARGLCAELCSFLHPDALLTAYEADGFHILLLDMVMPMLSGLELGRSIRRLSAEAQLIYITNEPGFALDAYAVNPLHYLIKPVDRTELFAALDLAVEKLSSRREHTVTLKTKEGLRTLSTDSILCCEYARHSVLYTLTNRRSVTTSTLPGSFSKHIAPLLRDRRFIQPHAAFAVNMSFVERLDRTGFTLRGGVFVPVSARQLAVVRSAYMSYRLGEG